MSAPHHIPARVALATLAALLPFAAPPAAAEELRLGASLDVTYNSNFLSSANDEESAVSFLPGPLFELSENEGRFRYDITYSGGYQIFVNQSGADAWESRLRARASYQIDRLTRVRLTNRFRDISNLRFGRQDVNDAATALNPDRQRYFRNDLDLEVTRTLTRRLDLALRSGYHWIDWEDNFDRNDSQAVDVEGELTYQLTTEHAVGAGLNYTYQDYEEALTRFGSRGDYINAFASWSWQISPNLAFNARGGPVWVRSDEDDSETSRQDEFVGGRRGDDLFRADFDSCTAIPESNGDPVASTCALDANRIPASDLGERRDFVIASGRRVGTDSDVTFFGNMSLTWDLDEWSFLALYQRRQSVTSGEGLASSLDRIQLTTDYQPIDQRWSVFVTGAWDRRETLTDATVIDYTVVEAGDGSAQRDVSFTYIDSQDSRRDNFTAITGVGYALTPRQSVTLEFRYRRTEGRTPNGSLPGIDTFFVVFTAEYLHDAWRF